MDITGITKAITELGFPIFTSVAMAFAFWIVYKRSVASYEAQHKEHREDILQIMNRYDQLVTRTTDAIDNVVDTFKESQKEFLELQKKTYEKLELTYENTQELIRRRR